MFLNISLLFDFIITKKGKYNTKDSMKLIEDVKKYLKETSLIEKEKLDEKREKTRV